jgi:hypothetical protein
MPIPRRAFEARTTRRLGQPRTRGRGRRAGEVGDGVGFLRSILGPHDGEPRHARRRGPPDVDDVVGRVRSHDVARAAQVRRVVNPTPAGHLGHADSGRHEHRYHEQRQAGRSDASALQPGGGRVGDAHARPPGLRREPPPQDPAGHRQCRVEAARPPGRREPRSMDEQPKGQQVSTTLC